MLAPFPRMNLDPKATPWGKTVQQALVKLETEFSRKSGSQDNSSRAATSTMATLSSQVQVLQALANVQYAEWSNNNGLTTGGTGWAPSQASVTISSPTGRLEIGFGGSLNSGNGTFGYQVVGSVSGTVISRDTVRANLAQRVAATGGAAFVGSSFNSVIVTVPANETLTVSSHMFAENATTYFFGTRILARVAP